MDRTLVVLGISPDNLHKETIGPNFIKKIIVENMTEDGCTSSLESYTQSVLQNFER